MFIICAFLVAASPAGREAPSPGIWRGAAPFKLWDSSLLALGGPPVGGVYKAVLRMPVIGDQTFVLQILRRRRSLGPAGITERGLARITLSGAMNLDEHAEVLHLSAPPPKCVTRPHTLSRALAVPNGRRRCHPTRFQRTDARAAAPHADAPPQQQRVSNRCSSMSPRLPSRLLRRIRKCTYCETGDFSTLVIAPPLVPAIRVRLLRQPGRSNALRRDADDMRSNHFKNR